MKSHDLEKHELTLRVERLRLEVKQTENYDFLTLVSNEYQSQILEFKSKI